MALHQLISIDEEKCVNCHRCISACPVKFPNIGTKDFIELNHDLCIGCGACIKVCTHDARFPVDDFTVSMEAIQKGEKVIAIIAPAVAASFPDNYLNLNGWLKSLGVEACFDVSFGAELTVKSYLEFIKTKKPNLVIAQPCPAIVNYIQIYKPELIPYLAPADSPMVHAMKMIRKYYPAYQKHKMMVISPCIAKKREFEETKTGDFNVTIYSLKKFFEKNNIILRDYPQTDYNNHPAERAVTFSKPGGLLETVEREVPDIKYNSRKIEGVEIIYEYLDKLASNLKDQKHPLLIDCLNCELGCNGGTGTTNQDKSPDELEYYINKRRDEMKALHKTDAQNPGSLEKLRKKIDSYWENNLYTRTYKNLSGIFSSAINQPKQKDIDTIFNSMHKYEKEDIKNCSSCGYNDCELMSVAIFNNLNKKENCHFYIHQENESLKETMQVKLAELQEKQHEMKNQKTEMIEKAEEFLQVLEKLRTLSKNI
ncbi:MAG: 4Fe-4S binding protein [Bacteroidales bacterium]|nr:4Fe-4S binding protein [Bacteroidales bacterium]